MPRPHATRRGLAAAVVTSALLSGRLARADTDMPYRDDCPDAPRAPAPLTVATSPTEPASAPPPSSWRRGYPQEYWGPHLSFGRQFTPSGEAAYYGTAELETIGLTHPGTFSVRFGLEGWGNERGGGGGLQTLLAGGLAVQLVEGPASPRFVLVGGLGWDWAYYDRAAGVGQFGILAPLANTYVGFDFRGIRLLAEVSAQYRWGWGGPDEARYRVGGALTFHTELEKRWR